MPWQSRASRRGKAQVAQAGATQRSQRALDAVAWTERGTQVAQAGLVCLSLKTGTGGGTD